ncbi:Pectinacetylesterase [Pelomyxa schiedti]|nr:Pectinacetylesterase [Pelomyxa schiedti]
MGGNIVFRLGAVAAFACVSVLCGLAGSVVVVAVAGNDNDNGGGGPRAATADVVAAAPTMQLVMLRDGESRGTVCNDGTVAGYYIRLSVSVPASSNWLVHLEGGHWCWDDQTCMDRNSSSPYLMSNKYWTETLDKNSGVFSLDSTENPSFWDANQVYVNYCSRYFHTYMRVSVYSGLMEHYAALCQKSTDLSAQRTPLQNSLAVLFSSCKELEQTYQDTCALQKALEGNSSFISIPRIHQKLEEILPVAQKQLMQLVVSKAVPLSLLTRARLLHLSCAVNVISDLVTLSSNHVDMPVGIPITNNMVH